MSRVVQLFTILFLSLFVFVEIAEARLIRGGGRPTLSRVYEQTLYYVNDQYNNAGGISEDIFEFNSQSLTGALNNRSARAFINGDNNPISAFPSGEGCTRGYQQGEVNDANDRITELEGFGTGISPAEAAELATLSAFIVDVNVNDPCKWEFTQGEMISVEGLFQSVFTGFLADEVDYSVNWNINGVIFQGEIDVISGQSFAAITLNTLFNLAPGEYDISVSVDLSSDNGRFYYETPESTDGSVTAVRLDPGVCAANPNYITENQFRAIFIAANPGASPNDIDDAVNDIYFTDPDLAEDTQCGYNGIIQDTNAGTLNARSFDINRVKSFMSFTETLVILDNGQGGPVAQASAPVSIGAFLTGLLAIGLRSRMTRKKAKASA